MNYRKSRFTSVRPAFDALDSRLLLSAAPVLAIPPNLSIEEGQSVAYVARPADGSDTGPVVFSLGGGAPAGATINPTSGLFVWTPPNVQHIYSIPIVATSSADPTMHDIKVLGVMVFDNPPAVNLGGNATAGPGQFERTASFSDPDPDTWTASVNYGDGTDEQPLEIGPGNSLKLSHVYGTSGTYTVAVTVNDSQGGQGRGFILVTIHNTSVATIGPTVVPTTPTPYRLLAVVVPNGTPNKKPISIVFRPILNHHPVRHTKHHITKR